jgi:benzoylformate decarboxylase
VQALHADVKQTLAALAPVLKQRRTAAQAQAAAARAQALLPRNWTAKKQALQAKTRSLAGNTPIAPEYLMMTIAQAVPKDAVIVEEGLTSTRTLLSFLDITHRQRFYGLASGGIGFAIAGAIGIQLAVKQRPVLAVIGDGSAMYSVQALWTAAHLKLPIAFVIANNRSYRILKERVYALKGAAAAHDRYLGMDFRDPPIDFPALAQALGVPARQVTAPGDLPAALQEALQVTSGPRLIDVLVDDAFKG